MNKNKCCTCRFAEWKKASNGKLHQSGDGRCTWSTRVELAWSAMHVMPFQREHKDFVEFRGGTVSRKGDSPQECAVHEQSVTE